MTSDHQKQVMIHGILNQVLKAVKTERINVIGYIHWSYVDSYEWVNQYGTSFGLVGVKWNSANRKWQKFENTSNVCRNFMKKLLEIRSALSDQDCLTSYSLCLTLWSTCENFPNLIPP